MPAVTMTTTTRAAIFRGADRSQELAQVELGPLRPDDVIVEMRAVGICGSDLHMINGDWVRAQPMVLGHEGAGVVTHVGSEVTEVAVEQGRPVDRHGEELVLQEGARSLVWSEPRRPVAK